MMKIDDMWTYKGWKIIADYSCPNHMTWEAVDPDGFRVYSSTFKDLLVEIEDAMVCSV